MENESLNNDFNFSGVNASILSDDNSDQNKGGFVFSGVNSSIDDLSDSELQDKISAQEAEVEKAKQKKDEIGSKLDFNFTGVNAPKETSINPTREGEVVKVDKNKISVKHLDGSISDYNVSRSNVEVGDKVKPEAILGYSNSTNNKYTLSGINQPQPIQQPTQNKIEITGADIIHHLGFDPNKINDLNPSQKAAVISEIHRAKLEDDKKRSLGQTEFPVDFTYQNLERKKLGLPQMKSIMQQFTVGDIQTPPESISFGNHKDFPLIYDVASSTNPQTQEAYRDKLVENFKQQISAKNVAMTGSEASFMQSTDDEFVQKKAEQQADSQLAFEEQQNLDARSKTAQFVSGALSVIGVKQGQFAQDIARGFVNLVGGTIEDIGNISSYIYPTESTPDIQQFGKQLNTGANLNRSTTPVIDPYEALINNNDLSFSNIKNQIFSDLTQTRRGIGEGIGRSPELLKLYAGSELLEAAELPAALNLPIQGAISGGREGPEGIIKGAAGGIIYHYGGGLFGPYLGKVGNSLLWVAAPAAEQHLVNGTPLAQAIGESLSTGIFIGLTGGERALVTDGENVRSANLFDIPKISSGELKFVPPSFRTGVDSNSFEIKNPNRIENISIEDSNGQKINLDLNEASFRLNDLKSQLISSMERPLPPEEKQPIIDEIKKIQDGIILAKTNGDIDNVPAVQQIEINNVLKTDGAFNREEFINRESAYDSQQEVMNLLTGKKFIKSKTNQNGNLNVTEIASVIKNRATDLAKLVSFHLEDLYHRGLPPDYSVVMNRLQEQIPEMADLMTEEQKRNWYSEGLNYWNSNTADSFFSKMKLDAAEKLPNRMNAQQALDVLKGNHPTEFEWTVGLDKFLDDKKVEKFSKQELIDVMQKGQVRVEASVAQDNNPEIKALDDQRQVLRKKLGNLRNYGNEEGYYGDKNYNDPNKTQKLGDYSDQLQSIQDKLDINAVSGKPKYSLKAYTGEKLELPGAFNSKEVKLISPVITRDKLEIQNTLEKELLIKYNLSTAEFDKLRDNTTISKEDRYRLDETTKDNLDQYKTLYQAPHWDEPNVVAHYRSNDRTTTDGINIYFSEEFQSDWNHDIREQGIKTNWEAKRKELINEANQISQEIQKHGGVATKEQEQRLYDIGAEMPTRTGYSGVEPNPFMVHNWKELVLKRFIRDSVITKDENGNYKYDGIGWTTARQQKERYGKILEGKDFRWTKNNSGGYDFELQKEDGGGYRRYHELQNISLERFAELTTKEAATEVRFQEDKIKKNRSTISNLPETDLTRYNTTTPDYNYQGKFSLKEAIELRSGIGKYSDYDIALVNIARKIGKRFGAKYSQKEIETDYNANQRTKDLLMDRDLKDAGFSKKIEKIHYLEITPSMRQSLEKEGFSLYGLGGLEPLKSSEQGIRNLITTFDLFDEAKSNLVNAIASNKDLMTPKWSYSNKEASRFNQDAILNANTKDLENISNILVQKTVLNSGLNPEAFIDQAKLLYKGISDFTSFSQDLIKKYGDKIKPYLSDLWLHIQHGWETFNAPNWIDIATSKQSTTFNARILPDLGRLDPRNTNLPAEKDYLKDPSKHQSLNDKRFLMSGVMAAQWDSNFAETYDSMNKGRRLVNYFDTDIIEGAQAANKFLRNWDNSDVGEVIHQGNEQQKIFSYNDLRQGDSVTNRPPLTDNEANAYLAHRDIQDLTLNIKKEEILYKYRKRVFNLNEQLTKLTSGTPQYTTVLGQLQTISNRMNDVRVYYDKLKNSGYVSLQRSGLVAAFIEDANGNKQYNQFADRFDAGNWIKSQIINGANASTQDIYDVKNLSDFSALTKSISPANFEDLVEASGFPSTDPTIEKLRDQVYSQFASSGYLLKRDFVSGYERTWDRAISATVSQAQKYAANYYANVVGDQALISLAKSGFAQADPNLYHLAKGYIEDEVYSPETTRVTRTLARARRLTSFIQLGWQFNRFVQHAIGKPMANGLSYYARVEDPNNPGSKLDKLEPEKYFSRGVKLGYEAVANWLATKPTTGGIISETRAGIGRTLDKTNPTALQQEFFDLYSRLNKEQTTQPRYVKSLLMMDTENIGEDLLKTNLQKFFSAKQQEQWASIFLRAGERVSRSQTAASAFLVGKEKFNLGGEQLVDFVTKAVNAIESNPSRGENPYVVRRALSGLTSNSASLEAGKLAYQFFTFEHMWWQNLALNIRSDFNQTYQAGITKNLPKDILTDLVTNKNAALNRTFIPLLIMGGLSGIPLFKFAKMGYAVLTGNDPKKKFDSILGKGSVVENLALNGITGNVGIAEKMTPEAPILDKLTIGNGVIDTLKKNTLDTNVPVVATTAQILQGFSDLLTPKQRMRGLGEVGLRPVRDIFNAARISQEGVKDRSGFVIIPRSQVTTSTIIEQGLGITPNKVIESVEKKKINKLIEIHRRLQRSIKQTL